MIDEAAPGALFARAQRLLGLLGTQGMRAGYWTTFWLPAGHAPSQALEELALALAPHAAAGPRCAGVEWWLGRAHTTRIPVGFHFDLDVKGTGAVRCPLVSSVFFFNRVRGGQLAVTDQRPDPRGRPQPAQATALETVAPAPNRYAVFDGSLFHGVLDAGGHVPGRPLPGPPGRLRRTLVVNYWAARPSGVPAWAESRAYRALRG